MTNKVIVTNVGALKAKYGGTGVAAIRRAVRALVAADAQRGIRTRLVALDDRAAMKTLKAPAVTAAANPAQNKAAVDGVYRALMPEYVVILGSVDVVPHQDVRNPVFDGDDDPDRYAYSDVPYACEAPYSRRPQDFIGPTRVVGRLPDLAGARDPRSLVALLEHATTWRRSPRSAYEKVLAISARVWRGSTRLSLEALGGAANDLQLSPARGPKWTPAQIGRRSHFINCHGNPADPHFYGQRGEDYPVSHDAAYLDGRLAPGTVAAVECCYGAELYDPALVNGQAGIANTYLAGGAYGYFGSSTIAYGPEDDNGSADLICQDFLRRVLAGASLGRAALEARQEFAQSAPELDPIDLKTLMQFNLLGDPSIHPVDAPVPHAARAMKAARVTTAHGAPAASARIDRRRQLLAKGLWVARHQAVAHRAMRTRVKGDVRATLQRMARSMKLASSKVLSFEVQPGQDTRRAPLMRKMMAAKAPAATAFHVVLGRKARTVVRPAARVRTPFIPAVVALVAKEVGGRIVAVREVHRR